MGLPPFWCCMFPFMAFILPSVFHTAAIWLTVYLAVQRYIYICLPKYVGNHCSLKRTKQVTYAFLNSLTYRFKKVFYIKRMHKKEISGNFCTFEE